MGVHHRPANESLVMADRKLMEFDGVPPLRTCGCSRNFYNLLVLCFSFFWLFTAFSTSQSLATPLFGDLGSITLLLLYAVFGVTGLVAPYIVRRIGARNGMIASSISYVIFVASCIYLVTPWLLVAAALIGFGGQILWTSHGMMMSQITTDENKGRYVSLFQGILYLMLIPGNLTSHFLLNEDGEDGDNDTTNQDPLQNMAIGWSTEYSVLFIVLAITCACGVGLLFCLRPPDPRFGSVVVPDTRSLWVQIKGTAQLLGTKKMLCVVPLFWANGVEMVMWASWFTRQMYKKQIGLVLPVVGVANFIGGLTFGSILDKFGYHAGLGVMCASAVGAYTCLWFANVSLVAHCETHAPEETMPCESYVEYGLFYASAIFLGFLDCSVQTLAGTICTKSFSSTGQTADAFAIRWAMLGVGATFGFGISSHLSIEGGKTSSPNQLRIEIIIVCVFLAVSCVGFIIFLKKFNINDTTELVLDSLIHKSTTTTTTPSSSSPRLSQLPSPSPPPSPSPSSLSSPSQPSQLLISSAKHTMKITPDLQPNVPVDAVHIDNETFV